MAKRYDTLTRALAVFLCSATFVVFQQAANGHDAAATGAQKAKFQAYDNSDYDNVDLVRDAGLVKAAILYQKAEWVECTRDDKLPPRAAFQAAVRDAAKTPGPLVLDFENIWIKNVDPEQAHRRYLIWRQLFVWAKEAAPGRMIGAYDLLGPNTDQYLDCARDLSQYQDGFFPHLYTAHGLDQATWERRLDNRVASARNVNASKPLIPYLRPQEEATCDQNPNPPYLPAARWRRQLDQIGEKASGFVIWSPVKCSQESTDLAWVTETVDFMRSMNATAASTVPVAAAAPSVTLTGAAPLAFCAPTPGVQVPAPSRMRPAVAPSATRPVARAAQCDTVPALLSP